VVQDQRHKALLNFIRKVVDVPLGYSKGDLLMFRSVASRDYRSLVPLIDEYMKLAERADTDAAPHGRVRKTSGRMTDPEQMHLFDMLREKRLFPSNSELSEFAGRVLPNMSRHRFDKMSRGDIATRIIEYLETKDHRTREELEASMRDAMVSGSQKSADDRKTFFSKWEKIIKGIQL
jgi:rubrerythrin